MQGWPFSFRLVFGQELPKEELPKEALPLELPKDELPKEELPKELPKEELPKEELPKEELPKELPKEELPEEELPKEELPKELPKEELPKEELPKEELPKEQEIETPCEDGLREEPPASQPDLPEDDVPEDPMHGKNDAFSKAAMLADEVAESGRGRCLRRRQLQTRQDEREERDKDKESRKSEKSSNPEKPEPKKRGRPRKVEVAADEEDSKKKKPKQPVEAASEEPEMTRRGKPAAKKRKQDQAKVEADEGAVRGKGKSQPKAEAKKRPVKSGKMEAPREEPSEVQTKMPREANAELKSVLQIPLQEEEPADPHARRRRLRRLTEDVQEMDEALSKECFELMKEDGDSPEVQKDDVRSRLFPNCLSCPLIKVVFYWDRNAVGLKVKTDDSYPQLFYFHVKGCATIKVATILAKRMYDKLIMKGHEWAHTDQATLFEQVLKNSACHARSLDDE